jgi:NAD(P)H dehydrogenase (quinone)
MKSLVIYAHPNPFSLNHSIKVEVVRLLKAKGDDVKVSDLYEMEFNPVLMPEDFNLIFSGTVAEDVKVEQDKIRWADRIIVISPIWWTGFPAILKGYFDRVLTYGFAYTVDESGFGQPLKGKKALLISTHGQPESVYHDGMYGSFVDTQDKGVFGFCGFELEEHKFFAGIMGSTEEQRKAFLASLKDIV